MVGGAAGQANRHTHNKHQDGPLGHRTDILGDLFSRPDDVVDEDGDSILVEGQFVSEHTSAADRFVLIAQIHR